MSDAIYIVQTNPLEGREDEYNDWYTNQHLQDIVALPGFVSAQRFVVEPAPDSPSPTFRYVAAYTIEGSVEDALAALAGAASSGLHLSSSLAPEMSSTILRPIGAPARKG